MERRNTKVVNVGRVKIGGNNPISIQSMTNTDTKDIESTIKQVIELEQAGCDIVRLAIYDEKCIETIRVIKKYTSIPLVADIHFDYRLAIKSIKAGIDKLRINPGNIGSTQNVQKVVDAAKERNIPIRIGVNSGSIKKDIFQKYGNTPKALGESALEHVRILESLGYEEIVISLKSSDVLKTIEAYKYIAKRVDYPLHIGITEAGTLFEGTIKSAIGIGYLLTEGIGDTLRVSLTDSPLKEVEVGIAILKTLGLKQEGIEIISCPTCGRCDLDLLSIVKEVREKTRHIDYPLKVAIMGCVVNGPGEAKDADLGIAGGRGKVALFKKGEIVGTYPKERAVELLLSSIQELIDKNERYRNYPSLQ
ncbi:MAG TPA: flavodoxin-dependent (E)-4-hydroxy-3-methylbut-2-enyl-diphosphate synthase [Clostridiales bacterium]|nr:flavodoxin-dependent (E)-4-hydroxy-3-methylbut-2-enyl-diphosphate synthase [Clostridiales bacterium]